MFRSRRVAAFFLLRLVVVYGLLAAPWPGVRRGYAKMFAWCADGLVHRVWGDSGIFGGSGYARVDAEPIDDAGRDLKIIVARRVTVDGRMTFPGPEPLMTGSRQLGYLPAAATIALILATPIGRLRRLRAVVGGLALIR